MSKIVKNNTGSDVDVDDVGRIVPASGQYTITPVEYPLWAASDDIVTLVGDETLTVNDGSFDLGISDGIDLIKGIFPSEVSVSSVVDDVNVSPTASFSREFRLLICEMHAIKHELKITNFHLAQITEEELDPGDMEDLP